MPKTPMEAVFYYRPTPSAHEEALRRVCAVEGIRFRTMSPPDVEQSVGYLIGAPGYARLADDHEPSAIAEELLILYRFDSRKMDRFLAALRKAEIPRIALKAAVTEHNIRWTLSQLYSELLHERQEIEAMRKAAAASAEQL